MARRGWCVFPMSPLARFSGNPDLLFAEATSEVSRLEELAVDYPTCRWRVAIGPSSLCIVRVDGYAGTDPFGVFSQDQGECLTLQAHGGATALAFFRFPKGMVLRASASKLFRGVRILCENGSCLIPPTDGFVYSNPWAEIETLPYALREFAFEAPDNPGRRIVPVPTSSPCQSRCRSTTYPARPRRDERKGYANCGQSGRGRGVRISCRR